MTQQASARRLASAAAQAAREAGQQAAREVQQAQQASAPVQTAPTGEWELWVVLQGAAQGWAAGTAAAAQTSQTLEGQNPQQARQNPHETEPTRDES